MLHYAKKKKQITNKNLFNKVYHERERLKSSMSVPLLSLRKKKMERNDWTSNRSREGSKIELEIEFSETKGD